MGLAQSHPESEWYSEGEEATETEREEEGGSGRTAEDDSLGEGGSAGGEEDGETEDPHSPLGPALLGDAGGRCEVGVAGDRAPEPAPPATGEEEPKSESEGWQQSKETAAGDGGTEGEGERGTERGGDGGGGPGQAAGPVREPAPGSAQTETGNHSEGDNSSAESPSGAKGEPAQPETAGGSISQSGAQMERAKDCFDLSDIRMERSEEHLGQSELTEKYLDQSDMQRERMEECLGQSDPLKGSSVEYLGQSERAEPHAAAGDTTPVHNPLSLPELTINEEKPADDMVQTIEHTKCQQLPLPEHDITSCSSATETGVEKGSQEEEGGACDVNAEAANVHSGSMAEAFHLHEDSRKTTFIQEVQPPEEEDKGTLLANDGILSSVGTHCTLSGVNADSDVWREEERSDEKAVTSLSEEPHPQILSNQGTAETLKHEPSAGGHCTGSGPNQENQEAELGSEVMEIDTEGINAHSGPQIDETTLGSEVIEEVTDGKNVHLITCSEETTVGSEVIEIDTGGSVVQSASQIDKIVLGSKVMETVTGGNDVCSDDQIEDTTLGSEVTDAVTGESDVHSDSQKEETTLGSEVMQIVRVGNDVHSDSCREEITLESEVMETVTGGSDVRSDGQKKQTALGSEVTETVIGGSDVRSDGQKEETTLGSEVTETVTGEIDVHSDSQKEQTALGSEVTETVISGSDVHSDSQKEETALGSEVIETVTGGNDVHPDGQKEETTLGSEVMETVAGGSDVRLDGQKEEATLGSEVIETVTGGNDVHPDGQKEETTLGSEVMETVAGGSDVRLYGQKEEATLGSEVIETVAGGSDVHSDSCTEAIALGSEVAQTVTAGSDVHSDGCTEMTTSEREVDTHEHETAATFEPVVVCLNDVSSGTMSSPTDGGEPTRDPTVTMDCEPEEELERVDNKNTTPQATSHDPTAPEASPENSNPDCADAAEHHGPSLDPTLELRGEECEDVEERKSKTSVETHAMPATEDVSMVSQEDSRGGPSSAAATDAGDEEIHREGDSLRPSPLCADAAQAEKRSSEQPESSPRPAPRSTGSSASLTWRDSGSDGDGFFAADAGVYSALPKVEVELVSGDSVSEVSVSCSSNDDAASLGPPASAPECSVGGRRSWSSEEVQRAGAAGAGEEEEKDRLTEVPAGSALLLCPARSPSPFRRHSWGPGRSPEGEAEISQRRLSGSLAKGMPTFQRRSYSLEGLSTDGDGTRDRLRRRATAPCRGLAPRPRSAERGSAASLTEDDLGEELGQRSNSLGRQISAVFRPKKRIHGSMTLPLSKSVSLSAINQREQDGMRSSSSVSSSSAQRISEEAPGPLRAGEEGKSATKVGRTFSYIRSKMYKKTKEKEKEKNRGKEKEKEVKERDKRTLNGHVFSAVSSAPVQCHQCHKTITAKEAFNCTNCNAHVHKPCRETLPACTRTKMKVNELQKQQFAVPDPGILRCKSAAQREQPWAVQAADVDGSRRPSSIRPFCSTNLSKSISVSNIAGPGLDEIPLKSLRYLSQSTDSLNQTSKVNESTESLTDEGTEMMDSQLMGEFEAEAKELEPESWTFTVGKKYLKQLRKDVIKRQDVIYELVQTEMHHVRTLKIMSEVFSKGLQKEVQLEAQTVERVFPMLDELLEVHSGFLAGLLDRKREARPEEGEARREGDDTANFLIRRIGDVLVTQFSGSSGERMKKVYGKFCGRHKEALNFYKELHAKDKRFQAFIKRKMSSPVVRRLGVPECILLVTQRITKYPVLLQRLLHNTKEGDEDRAAVAQALGLVREVTSAVDRRVSELEQKQRLREVYRRTDGRSIMRMHSGQMFAREDLLRGRRLLHHGPLQLKTSTGRLKDVQALLLSDVFVFLQEKDQKYVFASLDQRSSVLSLQKLIVREVANEERGLFLIAAGEERPEMVEVHAGSREERNAWIQLVQDAVASVEKEEDEGVPSESEEDKRVLETKAKEMRNQLRRKDQQIAALLEEKLRVFQDMGSEGGPGGGALFRALAQDTPTGELAMTDALREVESLQALMNTGQGGAVDHVGSAESVWAPCRPEIFSSFDRNQTNNISKNGEADSPDLQRTESDSALKKGGNSNVLLLRKRDSEVLHSVCRLHELLSALQAVVVQQDSVLEEQRSALTERPSSSSSSSPSSSSSLSSSWRSSSLVEQEKQRSLEKQRQEVANLQRQQEAHAAERRRRESEWEERERELTGREARLLQLDEETRRGCGEVQREQQELRCQKEEYQRDLERLREAQRRLERDGEQVEREQQQARAAEENRSGRAPSSASEDSLQIPSPVERRLSSSPIRDTLIRMGSLRKGKTLNPFASNPGHKAPAGDGQSHISGRLLQLTKTKEPKEPKEKKDPKEKKEKKKKKKDKGQLPQPADSTLLSGSEQPVDREILFC
ncbi:A-kinase anchor protein 13-like [Anguilla anguilla]|uniref:A-kinase anchor protein 13-like n=1 Tax=Anguilla anguilla TaxID=7936 RepID=UPI0015A83CDA|nr:A-kinase anchor protein 13-like [Anguilla anguilla]